MHSRLRGAFLLVLCAMALTSSDFAAKLPDWASALAATAPEVPPTVPNTSSRVLLDEIRYSVLPDGSLKIRRRYAVQALSVDSDEIGTGGYGFEDTAKITSSKAWHLPPGDSAKKSHETPVDVTFMGGTFLSGSKTRLVRVEGVKKGSLVFFEFEALDKPYFLSLSYLFYDDAPVSKERFELETPPGWTVRWAWIRQPGAEPETSGSLRAWELRDLPVPKKEDLAPEPAETAPLLGINVTPPLGTSLHAAVFTDWGSVSSWYTDLARGRQDPTSEVEVAWKQVSPSGNPGALDKVLAAATLVRDKVRYVAVELGIGGFQPHPAGATLTNLYGDCKDKATLLQSMLTAAGVPSYPVLVNLGTRDTVPQEIPVLGFNHMVAAAVLPKETEVPPRFKPALLEDPELGRLLILDSTDEYTAVGSLSSDLAGHRALIAAGPKGKLVTLPTPDPSANRVERTIKMRLLPEGKLGFERVSRYYGDLASEVRAEYHHSSQDRRHELEKHLANLFPGSQLQGYTAEVEAADGAFTESIQVAGVFPDASGADRAVHLFPGAPGDLEKVPLSKRGTPVDYRFPRAIHYDVTIEGAHESAPLPDPIDLKGDGWSIRTSVQRTGGTVHADWDLVLARTRFEPAAFPELRKLWGACSNASGEIAILAAAP